MKLPLRPTKFRVIPSLCAACLLTGSTLPVGCNYAIDTSIAGQVDIAVTNAVPEPSTYATVPAGADSLVFIRRRGLWA